MDSVNPSWLENSFLQSVLQSVQQNDQKVKIERFQCQSSLPPGSNYLSHIYKLNVDYETENKVKSISLIVKIPLNPGQMKDFMEEVKGYKKEITIYQDVLPKMYALHSSRLTPRSFTCPLDSSLVLEDLSLRGYGLVDRVKQLDLPHCRQVLAGMAKLHALSVAASQKYPSIIDSLGPHFIFNDQKALKEQKGSEILCQTFMKAMIRTVKSLSGCEQYVEMLNSVVDTYWRKVVNILNTTERINVLCHNDPWTANFMFKYDNASEVVDVNIIDFQMCSFGSFALDILFFFATSANEEVREHHREEIFEVYRHTFNNMLQELNCKEKLSKSEFDQNIRKNAPYALFAMSTVLTVSVADPDDPVVELSPVDQNTPDDSPQWQRFRSKYYKAVLPKLLRQVESLGAFF